VSHISAAVALWLTRMASIALSVNVIPDRSARHHAFASAGIPAIKEPPGLSRSDRKRPNGLTLIPWQAGKALSWEVTVVCPLAESYVDVAAQDAGAVAELAASRKSAKYTELESCYLCQPIVVESLGPLNGSVVSFLSGLGQRITEVSGEDSEGSFLFQRLSVLIQRFNAVLLHDCIIDEVAGNSR